MLTPWAKAVRYVGIVLGHRELAHRSIMCPRCNEIRYAPWQDLIYLFNPYREWSEEDGELIRRMALADHASYGHPA